MSSVISITLLVLVLLASQPAGGTAQRLAWVDRTGKVLGTIGESQFSFFYPAVSPDATQVAVRVQALESEKPSVWVYDAARGSRKRLTSDAENNEGQPAWSPDGRRLAYLSFRKGLGDLFVRPADGSGADEPLSVDPELQEFAPDWSRDEQYIVFHTLNPKAKDRDAMYMRLRGDRTPKLLADGPGLQGLATLSPDGRFVAYGSNESGAFEIYVKDFPGLTQKWKISPNGGLWPKWRGNEIFFFEGAALTAATVQVAPTFAVQGVQKLFDATAAGMDPAAIRDFNPIYDVTRDGRRAVVVQTVKQ